MNDDEVAPEISFDLGESSGAWVALQIYSNSDLPLPAHTHIHALTHMHSLTHTLISLRKEGGYNMVLYSFLQLLAIPTG